jgi:ATP-binding cassette subfamily G (WHITE) protein 2 (PDR)
MSVLANINLQNSDRTAVTSGAGQGSYNNHIQSDASSVTQVDESERMHELARGLSRQFTRQSTANPNPDAIFQPEKDSPLDPFGANFNGKKWFRNLVEISRAENNTPQRQTGVAFSNLSVHGFGTDTDYQPTVGNLPFSVWGQLRGLLGAKKRKVEILNGFDGIIDPGEMVVVLGPPGS